MTNNIIVNDTIYLRQLIEGDEQEIFNTINQYRNELRTFLSFVDFVKDLSDSELFVKETLRNYQQKVFSIRLYKNNEFCGLIGIQSTDFTNSCCEVGYWLSPKFQHHGIMTQSLRKMISFIFTELHFHRIELKVAITNQPSLNVCERLHLIKEGIQRERILLYGTYYDAQIFSILQSEYN
ncbi:acetyltransferase GNAT family protein, putative [Entamoeba histolytica KU27]|uniref:Acetyltransferase GNAT family protein, putative n=1 Tax=Entamoeba histolytica KU27 TaxID=885311 RepID=M2SBH1_ENTHI|nr:acetyltransferase GNAT family protein, putative [Entamoeba histolytica KU27]